MARQPIQVHVFLYRERAGKREYAIFQRSDADFCWQGVCGGLEGTETLEEGARREVLEEAGVTEKCPLYLLESRSTLEDTVFDEEIRRIWGPKVIVVPMYNLAMPFDGEIVLSEEHTAMQWLSYDEAYEKVYFPEQKIALYELEERLNRGLLF